MADEHIRLLGTPILAGIYGTNPAGDGYQDISLTILFAHQNCNIAVGVRASSAG